MFVISKVEVGLPLKVGTYIKFNTGLSDVYGYLCGYSVGPGNILNFKIVSEAGQFCYEVGYFKFRIVSHKEAILKWNYSNISIQSLINWLNHIIIRRMKMINKVILMGRIAQELSLKQTQNGTSVLSFNIAIERNMGKDKAKETDFITCVAWKNHAEFINKYFKKGSMIAVEGNLKTRTYEDKKGSKHYVTEVYVDSVSFTGERKEDIITDLQHGVENYNDNDSNGSQDSIRNALDDLTSFEEILSTDGIPF